MTSALNVYAQKKVVGNPDYPVRDNAEIDINQVAASRPPAPFGYKPSTTTGLTFGYYGGELWVDGGLTSISDSTIALSASATNYVEATRAGVVSKNTVGFTAGQIPLYEITTDTGSIAAINDRRISNAPITGLLSLSVAGGAGDITLTAAQARNDILHFTGALTGNRNIIVPAVVQSWVVYNNTSGAFALIVKTAAGTGVSVPQGARGNVYGDGTNALPNDGSVIPAGSVMAFFQATAPTGWTQVTTHNNKAMRIVSGTGGGSGGSVAFTTAFASQAVAGSNSATTLTSAQIPAHNHTLPIGNGAGAVMPDYTPVDGNTYVASASTDNSTGGGGSHNHTFTGTAINLAVQYIDMILASKN